MLGDIRWSKEKNVHTMGPMNTVKSIQPFFISDVSYQREYSMLLLLRKKTLNGVIILWLLIVLKY